MAELKGQEYISSMKQLEVGDAIGICGDTKEELCGEGSKIEWISDTQVGIRRFGKLVVQTHEEVMHFWKKAIV